MNKLNKATSGAIPPRWAQNLLHWYCRTDLVEDLEGDLNEYFERNLKTHGTRWAKIIYCLDVVKFCRPYTIRKPDFFNLFIHYLMLNSYLKTTRRNLVRNKLFSVINIIGLAVSMSVGLLVIAFIHDLRSYDEFHADKENIYRIITHYTSADQPTVDLASTSVKVGQQIGKTTSAIKHLTILRSGFWGDAIVGSVTLPMGAMWADSSFFNVFTFPLLKGNPATALKDPYSLVLTPKMAEKLFGEADPMGKLVRFDTTYYKVTGITSPIPKLSHLQFDALVSFASIERNHPSKDAAFYSWGNIWQNYVYMVLNPDITPTYVQTTLDHLNVTENKQLINQKISVSLQPLKQIALGPMLQNSIGPHISPVVVWVLSGFALVVILSACFNYTNLSIARSLRRSREVGVRKLIGAMKSHVVGQFLIESTMISLLAFAFAFILFYFLQKQFLDLDPFISNLVSLEFSPKLLVYFLLFSVGMGIAAGLFPALFFSAINPVQVLKGASGWTLFRHVNLRKALILIQYTLSLIFITTTLVGYKQYQGFITLDLGFTTENILNIRMQGNKAALLEKELREIPEVKAISKSMMITSLGSAHGSSVKYKDTQDSSMTWLNMVDEQYLLLHDHHLIAGKNFTPKANTAQESEIIVNEQLLRRFNISPNNPAKAIGEWLVVENKKLAIVGVVKDFHYGTVMNTLAPVMFRYSADGQNGYLNVKITSTDLSATMAHIKNAWQKIDKVHPLEAEFYDDQIKKAYRQFSVMIRVIGFITFLSVCIASLGLLGMVVFTTETRLKEISIRKVLGASEAGLMYQMGKSFLFLLLLASLIALPVTYFFFDSVVLIHFAYHSPIGWMEMASGVVAVILLALGLISSQTFIAARINPAQVLKGE
ncbi:permease prefix domain 2-containing transporter [Cytophagaceae bacterium YF14B1]|uniref:Permease prefix domain 2-containing transporter n=1 Tax=Xanthocytophaga flava TaxID=3048013 RepID=A0AAE3QQ34_9BACT|nr:ABC transporter permease [Xanthocytophaga flavus]MDJ1482811.1 permease prefix domain 2-containing transporter [Xanthocytophaga flavus]